MSTTKPEKIIGIDLGTTNSAVAVIKDRVPTLLPNGQERIMPSVVGVSPQGHLLVGTPARNQYVIAPESTVRSIKRKMGTSERVTMGGKSYTPQEISALILGELERIAAQHMGEMPTRAVITVPAYFTDAQRQATKDAGEIAGLEVVRIINEPTAAALAYGLDRLDEDQMVLVYDLGGGTFDVSIIELSYGVVQVRATAGDNLLGGDDFDQRLADMLADEFEAEHGIDLRQDRKAWARLVRAAEEAKIVLSDQPFAWVREAYIAEKDGTPLHIEREVSRSEFVDLIKDLLEGTIQHIDRALADAELTAGDIDKVLLVGGSTRIPAVRELVANRLGLEPHMEVNPDEVVALGAAVQGGIIAGEEIDAILVDVTPHSLGIEVAEWSYTGQPIPDRYQVLIPRNTTIPTTKAEVFRTLFPDQDKVHIKVYQGENPVASQNRLLGEFLVEGLKPPRPGGHPEATVQFTFDIDGILHVTVTDRQTKKVSELTVRASRTRMSVAEKEEARRQMEAWEPANEMDEELAALLARARSALSSDLGVEGAEELQQLIEAVEQAWRDGDKERQEKLVDELIDLLFDIEEA